jgi:hypothetical protein
MKIQSFTHRLALIAVTAICAQPVTQVNAQTETARTEPAQTRPAPGKPMPAPSSERKPVQPPPPPQSRRVHVRLTGNVGITTFKASDSFKAVLGTASGLTYGGGAGLLFGSKLFVDLDVDRFSHNGERVFIGPGNERFGLGIPVEVTTMPIEVSVGWRARMIGGDSPWERRPSKFTVTTYVGAGAGVLKYEEKSDFAEPDEDVRKTLACYHIMGGAEFPVGGGFGVTTDLRYRWVPNGLGDAGVSQAFGEKDLGGFTFHVKATFTF